MVRPPCCDKLNVKKGPWTAEEDAKILAYVSKHGTGNWTSVPKKAGLRRCGKSCRLRWTNYLRPDLKHESFTPQEEELIVNLHAAIGSRWSIIAQQLSGRTDNDVKNYWNTKLKKKLTDMGIDPVTHKPFSQILADYGNIGGLQKPSPATRLISSLNTDLNKNVNFNMTKSHENYKYPFSNINPNILKTRNLLLSPKPEPVMEDQHTNSTHLLSQLHAINLVTQVSGWTPNHETITSSSSSSSSSTCSTAGQEKSTAVGFSWSDFLLDDELLRAPDHQREGELQGEELLMELSSMELVSEKNHVMPAKISHGNVESCGEMISDNGEVEGKEKTTGVNEKFHGSSSVDHQSFVEAMLDGENDMYLLFPDLSDGPFCN